KPFNTTGILNELDTWAESLKGMYGGVEPRGSPSGTKLHAILSEEIPKSVGNSKLLITEAIIDKDGVIRAHGKGPGFVNSLPGGNVKGTYETLDVLVIDDSKVN